MSQPMPQVTRVAGHPRLLVAGQPFFILGLQWACDSCFSKEEMNPLFPQAARLGCNTAVLPLYWREVEPQPGVFQYEMLDERIRQARMSGLRLVLLWFATWKNAHAFYAPDYIKNDPDTYPLALDREGLRLVSLCPSGEATWERDRQALTSVMAHLREVDADRTVIMMQLENEPGIMGSDRCYCPACNARFEAGRWEAEWGVHAAEAFSVASIHTYIDRLAAAAKDVYPLPLYVNVWLSSGPTSGPQGSRPGRNYPSGGAVSHMLELALQHVQHVDLIGPDTYRHGYQDFHRLCQEYSTGGNPLYIAEHSSSPTGRADRNVFYAIGQYGALGFDPWAIDSPFPERTPPPLVDPIGGEWGPQAYWLRDSYVSIGSAMQPIADALGSSRLFTFVQEDGEMVAGWAADGVDVVVTYHDPRGAGRGMLIQQSSSEFLALGVGFAVSFYTPRPDGSPIHATSVVEGRYEGDRWIVRHPVAGARAGFLEPGVARIRLDLHGRKEGKSIR